MLDFLYRIGIGGVVLSFFTIPIFFEWSVLMMLILIANISIMSKKQKPALVVHASPKLIDEVKKLHNQNKKDNGMSKLKI